MGRFNMSTKTASPHLWKEKKVKIQPYPAETEYKSVVISSSMTLLFDIFYYQPF